MADLQRGSAGIYLPEAVSGEILSKMTETSVVQSAARHRDRRTYRSMGGRNRG
jgi:hypothetical protein